MVRTSSRPLGSLVVCMPPIWMPTASGRFAKLMPTSSMVVKPALSPGPPAPVTGSV